MARLVLPDVETLGLLNVCPNIFGHCELDPAVWTQIAEEMGDSTFENLDIIAALIDAHLVKVARECKLKGIAKTSLNLAVTFARLKVGVPTADIFSQTGAYAPPGGDGAGGSLWCHGRDCTSAGRERAQGVGLLRPNLPPHSVASRARAHR